MARCDVLGAPNAALDAPLGLLTVSVGENASPAVDAETLARASNATNIKTLPHEDIDMVRADTGTPPDGLGQTHIRAITQIDGYDLSLALFSPENSAAQGSRGVQMINEFVVHTQDASVADAVAATTSSNTTNDKKRTKPFFAGLFD